MRPYDDENKITTGMVVALVIIVILFLVATGGDSSDEELEQQQYCEMVRINKKDPSAGWPDFNGNYKEVCEGKKK